LEAADIDEHTRAGMGEIEKVGNLDLNKFHIKIHSRDRDLDKSHGGSLKNSPFEVRNVKIDKSIQFDTNSQ
jgi:hypothetical protein